MKKILTMMLVFVLVSSISGLHVQAATEATIENEYIGFEYGVDDPGDYYIYQAGPSIEDLLYDTTSYTTVAVDGEYYEYRPESIDVFENYVTATANYGGVDVDVRIEIVNNSYSGRADVVLLAYGIDNTDEVSHDVGIRIYYDTMVGDNDNAPFKVAGIGNITTELSLYGSDVPEYWQAFDDIVNPSVIAQSSMFAAGGLRPDRLRFTNYSAASSNMWDYDRATGTSNGDSAVCIYFNPRTYAPGETGSARNLYGIGAVQQSQGADLSVTLTAVAALSVDGDGYNPNPFSVIGYIQNIGDGPLSQVTASIELPEGLTLDSTSNPASQTKEILPAGQEFAPSWKVLAAKVASDTTYTYNVTFSALGVEPFVLQRQVVVPGINGEGGNDEPVVNPPAPVPAYKYQVTAVSNPAGVASFSGTTDDIIFSQSYSVTYTLLDDTYEFTGWSGGSPNGTITGSDVHLVANFSLIEVEDETIPEEVPDVAVTPEEDAEPVEEAVVEVPAEDVAGEVLDLQEADETIPEAGGIPLELIIGLGASISGLGYVIRKRK